MAQAKFYNFLKGIGIQEETSEKLWNGNIQTLPKLASTKTDQLCKLTDDIVLLNTIHPVLHQKAFPITVADDPYAKASSIIKQHLKTFESPMEIDNPTIQSDADAISPHELNGPSNGYASRGNQGNTTPTTIVRQTMNKESNTRHGTHPSVVITGGSFTQANILGAQPVVYNNTNSTVSATSYGGGGYDREKLRKIKVEPGFIQLQDCTFSTADLHFFDSPDFWMEDTSVTKVDRATFDQRSSDDDYYPVTEWNKNRALLINITQFINENMERQGSHVDSQQLEEVLKQLGFEVTVCINQNKSTIEQYIREFASSPQNSRSSISLVFIGSHGERANNEDFFVGKDEQRIPVKDVISQFNGTNCPNLREKPKLFFFQFCRKDKPITTSDRLHHGPRTGRYYNNTKSDAGGFIEENVMPFHAAHNEADMLLSYATAAGTKAYRDTQDGSWFVTALCKILKERSHSEDLLSMLTKVNHQVMAKKDYEGERVAVQLAEFSSKLRKKVRFYPQ